MTLLPAIIALCSYIGFDTPPMDMMNKRPQYQWDYVVKNNKWTTAPVSYQYKVINVDWDCLIVPKWCHTGKAPLTNIEEPLKEDSNGD